MSCLEFEKLSYVIGAFNRTSKTILKGISGEFRSYGLSAIMGPSGGGKTTLLNILSGFTTKNVSGTIKVNGNKRDNETFRKRSAYIMQDENLHSLLTVHESMNFSIKLKTGSAFSAKERKEKILEILQVLGLDDKMETFAGMLSGGQQRRLSIALELVDDPQIMFFDEPTTGLDSSSSTQCLSLMKKLAQSGKTIICTIHQPSALLFEMFDHLYALSDGMCIYQGSSKNLVPFLTELDLVCPESYSPCDYLLEIATNDYGPQNYRLTDKIENGQNNKFANEAILKFENSSKVSDIITIQGHEYKTTLINQIYYLLYRNFLTTIRDPTILTMRICISILVAFAVGIMFKDIGLSASNVMDCYRYVIITIVFQLYSSYYSQITAFPLDFPIIKRETFNRHYSTEAYYIAFTLIDIPITFLCSFLFVAITYLMTNQPKELFRFNMYFGICLMLCYAAQGMGIMISSLLHVRTAVHVSSILLSPFFIFSSVLILLRDTAPGWHWLFRLNYVEYTLKSALQIIFGYNRTNIECSELYCHFTPRKILDEFQAYSTTMEEGFFVLLIYIFASRLVAFCLIKFRLRH